jgi:glycosyltransferase involved in cell wall biosynthesis
VLVQRISRSAYQRLGSVDLEFPLELDDVADSRDLNLAVPSHRPQRGTPLTIGWICTPPGPGSGGHTTMFRMIEAAEAAGHTCVLYLYDRFHGQTSRHEQIIRTYWPQIRAEVRSVHDGLAALDAYVATGWPTAHVLAARPGLATRRLYLVQDYEPYFYPHGSEYVLAEDTYRFGFRCIAVGWMVADLLRSKHGVEAPVAEYGCDTSVYQLTNTGERTGVVFYAKRGVARRGFELGVLALREFHRHEPAYEIHMVGDPCQSLPFPVTSHGRLPPVGLSQIYNRCRAGLAISFTNVSLVPAEMLACGVIPALTGSPSARYDLNNEFVRWADPSPVAVADQLRAIVRDHRPSPAEVSATVSSGNWNAAKQTTITAIENEVYGAPRGIR